MIKATVRLDEPDTLRAVLTITGTVGELKKAAAQIQALEYGERTYCRPLLEAISDTIEKAEKHFAQAHKTPDDLAREAAEAAQEAEA